MRFFWIVTLSSLAVAFYFGVMKPRAINTEHAKAAEVAAGKLAAENYSREKAAECEKLKPVEEALKLIGRGDLLTVEMSNAVIDTPFCDWVRWQLCRFNAPILVELEKAGRAFESAQMRAVGGECSHSSLFIKTYGQAAYRHALELHDLDGEDQPKDK